MQDFPPPAIDLDDAAAHPDVRTPGRFLWWLVREQTGLLATATVLGTFWFLPGALSPFLLGRLVDEGIVAGSFSGTALWAGLLLVVVVVGSAFGVVQHTLSVRAWLVSLYGTLMVVNRKTTQLGHVLPRRTPTGEVLSVATGDSDQFGALMEIITRAGAALIAYFVVATLVLSTSVKLGILVLVSGPLLVLLAAPLMRPLQRRQTVERTRLSELTSMATDIVAGLRILRGIGGEQTFGTNYARQSQRVRAAGVSAGTWQAILDASSVLLSGVFLVGLTWLGAREVLAGTLTVGQLISFFGYGVFMMEPIRTFFEFVQKLIRAHVSARKAVAILEHQPPWHEPETTRSLPHGQELVDEPSGFRAPAGAFTVVVTADPDSSAALADRLGRYLPADVEPVSEDLDEDVKGRRARRELAARRRERQRIAAQDAERAGIRWGVTVGGVDLSEATLQEVRRTIVVSDTASLVFAGTLQNALDPHDRLTRIQAEQLMYVACAEDVYDALPGGWQGHIDERGRGLSGGQRQRLVLARVLGLDPEVLVLVEPTSAVDAHTEARIAERLRRRRDGQTTVVMSGSPLLLHHAEHVVLLEEGRAVAQGTHEELLATHAGYRRVVVRTEEVAP
ncbi:MAG: ABC transporter transmembrane domain-containing protein [Propionibacteriaceae bacterium]